jgi:hypothetical protein
LALVALKMTIKLDHPIQRGQLDSQPQERGR